MCSLNHKYGRPWPGTLLKIVKTIFTFCIIIPVLKVWELAGRADRSVRLWYARKLEKLAYYLEYWAIVLKNKADRIDRTTG